jgi:hypothetical protein
MRILPLKQPRFSSLGTTLVPRNSLLCCTIHPAVKEFLCPIRRLGLGSIALFQG